MPPTCLLGAWIGVAAAQPIPDDLPEEDVELDIRDGDATRETEDHGFEVDSVDFEADVEDDAGMVDFVAAKRKKAPPPTWFHLDATGRQPFGDDWEIQHVATSGGFFLVQMPVLVATDASAFEAAYPEGVQLKALVRSGGHSLTFEQTVVGVYDDAPTWAFLQTAVPATGKTAEVKFDVWAFARVAEGEPKPIGQLSRTRTVERE